MNKAEMIAQQMAAGMNIAKIWGSILYNVKAYGAKGDGTTDDTAAVQSAINAASGGGVVYFPSGNTYLTTLLTVSNPNVDLFMDHCTLKTDGITITGANSGVTGKNGIIDNKLKVAAVSVQAASGTNVITFASHPFSVGDPVKSSYGISSDSTDAWNITATTPTTITLPQNTTGVIPVKAYVGTFHWSATIFLQGQNTYIRGVMRNKITPAAGASDSSNGLTIQNSRGYAIAVNGNNTAYIEGVYVNNNGLDSVLIQPTAAGNPTVYLTECTFGFTFDVAKQGIAFNGLTGFPTAPTLYMERCTFKRNTYDPEFFINGNHNGTEIHAKNCLFDGTGTYHPAPYNGNTWTCMGLAMNTGSTLAAVRFVNCEFKNYSQGVISEESGNTRTYTITLLEVLSSKITGGSFGAVNHITWSQGRVKNCIMDGQNLLTSAVWWLTNGSSILTLENNEFINDATTKNFQYCILKNNIFKNSPLSLEETSYGEGNVLIDSYLNTYPSSDNSSILRMRDTTIKHSSMAANAADLTNTVMNLLPANSTTMEFKLLNGNLRGVLYSTGFKTTYYLEIRTVGVSIKNTYSALYGDDWNIPVGSRIENVLDVTATRIKYVSKSAITTLSVLAASGTTTITVTSATGFAANDYINILLDNGRVWSTKVGGAYVSGTSIPIVDALPSAAASGAKVCDFLY